MTPGQRYSDASDFTTAVEPVRLVLLGHGFREEPVRIQGFQSCVTFRRDDAKVDLVYGPPEYHVEMFMRRLGNQPRTYELADLMAFPEFDQWIRANPPSVAGGVIAECRFFGSLLELAIPLVFRP